MSDKSNTPKAREDDELDKILMQLVSVNGKLVTVAGAKQRIEALINRHLSEQLDYLLENQKGALVGYPCIPVSIINQLKEELK